MTNVVSLAEHQRDLLPFEIAASEDGRIDAEELMLLQQGFSGHISFDPNADEIPLVNQELANDTVVYTALLDDQIGLTIDPNPESKVIGRNVLAAYKMMVYHVGLNGIRLRSKLAMWRTVAVVALVGCALLAFTAGYQHS